MMPPAIIFVVFNHRGHKFIKKFELPNFSLKYFNFFYNQTVASQLIIPLFKVCLQ